MCITFNEALLWKQNHVNGLKTSFRYSLLTVDYLFGAIPKNISLLWSSLRWQETNRRFDLPLISISLYTVRSCTLLSPKCSMKRLTLPSACNSWRNLSSCLCSQGYHLIPESNWYHMAEQLWDQLILRMLVYNMVGWNKINKTIMLNVIHYHCCTGYFSVLYIEVNLCLCW